MVGTSSESVPLLGEPVLPADKDGEATPNDLRTSRRRILRDCIYVVILVLLSAGLIIFLSIKKPTEDSSLLSDIRKLYNTPSLVAGVLRNGSFSIEVTGVRKYDDNETLVVNNDLWHLGSNTKAMTATILALLIEDGLLTWDTTLAEALPSWKGKMSPGMTNTTLAMIGCHRGGFSQAWYEDAQSLWGSEFLKRLWETSGIEGRQMVVEYALPREPLFKPGTKYDYSNTGYILLGYIMEQTTGKSWESLIKSRIFDPLNMTECRIGPALDTSLPPTTPWPHNLTNSSSPVPVPPSKYGDLPLAFGPAGLAHCSLSSYSKFLKFHLDGSKGRPSTSANISLSSTSFAMLHEPWPGEGMYSSGGWGVRDIDGVGRVLTHAGSNTLNYLRATIAPDREGVFVAATNVLADIATGQVIDALIDGRLLK